MQAKVLIGDHQTALVIFTGGLNLQIELGGTSVSGVWKINQKIRPDKVIIYLRNREETANQVYTGDFSRLLPSPVKNLEHRFAVEFTNTEFCGTTAENWNGFMESKRGAVSPVRYIKN